jgi:amidase
LQTLPEMAVAEIASRPPSGPFAGVPFVIKELVLHAKGVRTDSGCGLAQGVIPDADTGLMARFRRAGLVLIRMVPEAHYLEPVEGLGSR